MLPHNEDCKQILKLSLILTHIKTPGKTSAGRAVRRLALWAERYQKIVSPHPLRSCILSILFHS